MKGMPLLATGLFRVDIVHLVTNPHHGDERSRISAVRRIHFKKQRHGQDGAGPGVVNLAVKLAGGQVEQGLPETQTPLLRRAFAGILDPD